MGAIQESQTTSRQVWSAAPGQSLTRLSRLGGARPARMEFVVPPLQAKLPETPAPLADGHARQPHPLGNGGVD